MKDILVIGSLNYDIILKQDRLPKEGETYAVNQASYCSGGKGANQAVQAAKLGANVYMVGAVGNDAMGQYLIQTLEGYGVHTQYVKIEECESGMGIVNCLEDGSVFANIVTGANMKVTKEDIDRLEELWEHVGMLILQLEIPMETVEYAIKKAKEHQVSVMINAAPAKGSMENYIKNCDYFVVNEVESSYYCNSRITDVSSAKAAIKDFSLKYDMKCIFTLGGEGAVLCDGETTKHVPAHSVTAIETTGAGDSFVGAMGYCLAKGEDFFEAAEYASCCSALTVCGIGAQTSMPTFEEVKTFRSKL